MTAILIGTLFLAGLLWTLIRLRNLREQALEDELEGDSTTVLLGTFLLLSKACLQYHRDRGHYPTQVSGSPEALSENGYLDNESLPALLTGIHRFSIIATEASGSAVCLLNTPARLATSVINRVASSGADFMFFDMRGPQFVPLTEGVTRESVNLCLLLPVRPANLPDMPPQ